MNSITDGISTAIRTGNAVKKSAGSTRFQIHVKKSTKSVSYTHLTLPTN